MTNWVHVAVGVVRNKSGHILLAKRAQDAHQGGLWEFPGGKIETGEQVTEALARELQEEIGITPTEFSPLIQIRHHYPDKSVLLDVWDVIAFDGEAHGKEGQPIEWIKRQELSAADNALYPLPAANRNIVKAIQLPDFIAVSGDYAGLQQFESSIVNSINSGAGLIYLRSNPLLLSDSRYLDCASKLCKDRNVSLQMPASLLSTYQVNLSASTRGIIGIHLKSKELTTFDWATLPQGWLLGASCHNAEEVQRAADLGVDYIFLSPVKTTKTHPNVKPLGWDAFQRSIEDVNLPVYALGGVDASDLDKAKASGARGVAGISAFWN